MAVTYKRYSKDSLVCLMSMRDFLKKHPDFFNIDPSGPDDFTRPEPYSSYYFFDSTKFGFVYFDSKSVNFGESIVEKLGFIEVAYRDGITEIKSLDRRINNRERDAIQHPENKYARKEVNRLKKLKRALEKSAKRRKTRSKKQFADYLINTGLHYEWSYPGNYVVLDLETNGLRRAKDDLLSISLFSPKSGICYNRFLPLDQQPVVLTGWINHIRSEDLENEEHLTQEEFDQLIKEFNLDQATVLCYSGGDGSFDLDFLSNYCKRHGIVGCEKIKIQNIKSLVPSPGYGTEGQCTKDNLCRLFGIAGISDYHTSLNDCILEWQLFNALMTRKTFFVDNHLVEYTDGYVVPISYLIKYPCIADYANIEVPKIYVTANEIFSYEFPPELIARINKFSTNISGLTIESAIDYLLGAKEQDNYEFLASNRKKLKYIGSLDKNLTTIPLVVQDDGTIVTTNQRFSQQVKMINESNEAIKEGLASTIEFIQKKIFHEEPISSQEMVISDDGKILALCDLSSDSSILEIKTYDPLSRFTFNGEKHVKPEVAYQLYYQSRGRKAFLISLNLSTLFQNPEDRFATNVCSLSVKIYETTFSARKNKISENEMLPPFFKQYFDEIKANKKSTYKSLMKATDSSRISVQRNLDLLKRLGFIEHIGSRTNGSWRILKEPLFWD